MCKSALHSLIRPFPWNRSLVVINATTNKGAHIVVYLYMQAISFLYSVINYILHFRFTHPSFPGMVHSAVYHTSKGVCRTHDVVPS